MSNSYKYTTVLVTGATGFVGRALCKLLLTNGYIVYGTILDFEKPDSLIDGVIPVTITSIDTMYNWKETLANIDVIVHLAARVHIMKETAHDSLNEFMKVNSRATEILAREAAVVGVHRFIFLSTIGVNGDNSHETLFTETDMPFPHNNYSLSKLDAETKLSQISHHTGLEVVIIRAPIVYGNGNPGNFLSLLKYVSARIPLPLASIKNRRSLIFVGNLVDAIALCAAHPNAVGKTYLVSDGTDVSTPELVCMTAVALGIEPFLIPFPTWLIRFAGKITGKTSAVNRLLGSLAVDSSRIRRELGWKPPFTMEQGLAVTAKWFLNQR